MTPSIDGKIYHFEFGGLYDGLSLLRDFETGTIWNHITGEAMFGSLEGERLATYNLLQTTVEAALEAYPDLEVAMSDRPIRKQEVSFIDQIPVLGGMLRRTMAREDNRRPQMELGLGIWRDDTQRYYPMNTVRKQDGLVIDAFEDRQVVVYIDPRTRVLASLFTDAKTAKWAGWDSKTIQLSDGTTIRGGVVFDAEGERIDDDRPLQLFTRWYGFALTFPETTIYEP